MRGNFDMKGVSGRFTLILALGVVVLNYRVEAQNRGIFVPYSTVAFGVGTSNYYGDMAAYSRPISSTFNMMRWSVGANYTRHFTPRLAARAAFNYARIAGDDYVMNHKGKYLGSAQFARNLNFRNDLKEFSVQGIFKLTPDNRSADRRPQFGAYLFAGIGIVAHNPKAMYRDSTTGKKEWIKLQTQHTEGQGNPGYAKPYSLVSVVIPFGLGLRYKINASFDISAELGFRYSFSDYLDDISGAGADPAVFADNPLALSLAYRYAEPTTARKGRDRTAGLQKFLGVENPGQIAEALATVVPQSLPRGNAYKDTYMTGMIHIHYILPAKIKCPPLK
jgi:hypothetical protein